MAAACGHIARAHAAQLPDLTGLTVLLPQLHARSAFAQALQAATGKTVVLLPRVTTPRAWAAEMQPEQAVIPHEAREALL